MGELSKPRPKWAEAIRRFITDDVIDEKYNYPEDGSDDSLHSEVEEAVNVIFCRTYGHEIIDDQCGIPAHRFCVYCGKRENVLASPS